MTLNEYLNFVNSNPKAKTTYSARYMKIKGDITSTWYTVKDTKNVVVSIQIPSEKAKHVSYNVVLEFPEGTVSETAKKLLNSEMKVFSNCPSFVFMNAKYFEEKGFLINWAKPLYDPKVFEETEELSSSKMEANKEKSERDVKCEKSLFFAAMHIRQMSTIGILTRLSKAQPIKDTNTVLKHIKNSNDTLNKRLRNAKKHPLSKYPKKENKEPKSASNVTKKVGTTKMIKKVGSVKSVSKIKHI